MNQQAIDTAVIYQINSLCKLCDCRVEIELNEAGQFECRAVERNTGHYITELAAMDSYLTLAMRVLYERMMNHKGIK